MSIPRITEIMEELSAKLLERLGSQDEATREKATAEFVAFATLKELTKIRMLIEDETGTEISDDELDFSEELDE